MIKDYTPLLFYDIPGKQEGFRKNYQNRGRQGYDRRQVVPEFFNSLIDKQIGRKKSEEEAKAPLKQKQDPFGGIKPRDETEYKKHKQQKKTKDTVVRKKEPEEVHEEPKSEAANYEKYNEYEQGGHYGEYYDSYHEPRYRRRGYRYNPRGMQWGRYREPGRSWQVNLPIRSVESW
jgi:hypothetical protein